MSEKKRYVIVGTGSRSRMFFDAITGDYADDVELVGLCDVSPTRMSFWNRLLDERGFARAACATPDTFDELVEQTHADEVIVCSVDATHHTYIVRAMELGCDVITEKPMTTDEAKVGLIFDAIERTGRSLRVAFNYRWQPAFTKLREIVASGAIGKPTLVDFQWRLNTNHGADYFRRWHRQKEHSGGMLVHKSTHHFDLVNWILDDRPDRVFAEGGLMFYGERNAAERGRTYDYDRYTGEPAAGDDPFALHLDDPKFDRGSASMRELYLEAEDETGYIRDQNVFGGEDRWPITIEDTIGLTARYARGAILNYSLVNYCPWEGERLAITGTEGHVEYFSRNAGHIIAGQSDEDLAQEQYAGEQYIRLQRMFNPPQNIEIPKAEGGHGGGDRRLLERIFQPGLPPDEFGRDATHIDGAWSVLTGVAANRSLESDSPVRVPDLLPGSIQVAAI